MDMEGLAKKLHSLERKVLPYLEKSISFDKIVEKSKLKEIEVMRALQWMENKDIVKIKSQEKEVISLGKNGLMYKEKGLPEKRFLNAVKDSSMTLTEIGKKTKLDRNELNISIGLLKRKKAIEVRKKKDLVISITSEGKKLLKQKSSDESFLELKFPVEFNKLKTDQKKVFKELLKRKDMVKKDKKVLREVVLMDLGMKLSKLKISDNVVDKLTSKMLKDGSWKKNDFRRYDVEINVPNVHSGKRHFTNQVIEFVKSIWLDLGFEEMTGRMVHSSFWCLDTLFVPQDHPARDMQDTFYLKNPEKGILKDNETVSRVKKTHEKGWTTGSLGWGSKWSEEKAKENLLRTHTTVLSAEALSKLKKDDLPRKFFAVGKNFRNEALDWKHLFEFYQVEGIVVDEDANIRNLLGYLKNFFAKMGFPDVRIRPGHFPYTEPSAEVDVWHPVKKQWVEIGGSGIFRPEVTKPIMGFEVPVAAWGLSLGRLIMDYWDIQDLRQYYKNDLKQLRELKVWMK